MFGNLCGPHGEIMWEIAFFYVVFIFIIGLICFQILRNFMEWHRNNQSPIETCQALLVIKRTDVFGNETAPDQLLSDI